MSGSGLVGRRRMLGGAVALGGLGTLGGCGIFDDDVKPITPGHRIDVLPSTTRLIPDPSLAARPVALGAPSVDDDWPQPGRVPSHVAINAAWPGTGLPIWTATIGRGHALRSELTAPPLVVGDRVFTMDADANVGAFDRRTGRLVWLRAVKPRTVRSTNVGGGITYADGTVFAATGLADVLAIDGATGKPRWRVSAGIPVRSAPTVADGRLYFGTIDQRLFALDVADGHTVWTYQASQSFDALLGQPAPAVAGNVVVGGFGSGEIATLNAIDGSVIWSDTLGGLTGASPLEFSSIFAEPVIDADTVYAISVGGLITATDIRTGRRVWERAVGGSQSPVIIDGWIFLLTSDQTVTCLEQASGHVRWTSVLPRYARPNAQKQPILWSGPVLAGGKLVLVSDRGTAVSVDAAEGVIESDRRLRAPASMAPIVAGNDLFVLTDDGRLTAYR